MRSILLFILATTACDHRGNALLEVRFIVPATCPVSDARREWVEKCISDGPREADDEPGHWVYACNAVSRDMFCEPVLSVHWGDWIACEGLPITHRGRRSCDEAVEESCA